MSSSYLDHLPAAFRSDTFVGDFLLAFEALFTGRDDAGDDDTNDGELAAGSAGGPGLQQRIDDISRHFDPVTAPPDFLPWLAGWVALAVPANWDTDTTRGFIREIVPLYARRGTIGGLRRMLEIFLRPLGSDVAGNDVVVHDAFDELPHYFQVRISLPDNDSERIRATRETARAIIDREKPAHTVYALKIVIPTMRLVSEERIRAEGRGQMLRLGGNTWLGTAG
ncbi:phage tail protein I [Frankia sp. CNm7]|uniref:Phage tail protein I n=1 Tax=Frankia nepalensis TaxID=1836974 RepID=A0A937R9E9_9ACTN|nr:phage tail protein I [Frankia nepalensis]MBL7494832.1 phage tail protein I [Frankia nepalensis]MBL7508981.1 phage tail protein I [Frankia nepalensis]MBL7524779.1 phage tail protein I [Frankia nepalensis]MBL7626315.1 phage tail protein I [Frankia nepalensis]